MSLLLKKKRKYPRTHLKNGFAGEIERISSQNPRRRDDSYRRYDESREDGLAKKFADWSPNAFLRWVLIRSSARYIWQRMLCRSYFYIARIGIRTYTNDPSEVFRKITGDCSVLHPKKISSS